MPSRGPYDRNPEPFPGEPLHVQLLAQYPDDDDVLGLEHLTPDELPARLAFLSRLALSPACSSPTPVDSGASPKPAHADTTSEPSLPRDVVSARGHQLEGATECSTSTQVPSSSSKTGASSR
jgi:hypothetical protein